MCCAFLIALLCVCVLARVCALQWIPELQHYYQERDMKPPVVLVGTKMDIWDKKEVPESAVSTRHTALPHIPSRYTHAQSRAQIQAVVEGCDMIKSYKLCSALSGDGVDELFQEACRLGLMSAKADPPRKKACVLL